jgi:hypothetical protein
MTESSSLQKNKKTKFLIASYLRRDQIAKSAKQKTYMEIRITNYLARFSRHLALQALSRALLQFQCSPRSITLI